MPLPQTVSITIEIMDLLHRLRRSPRVRLHAEDTVQWQLDGAGYTYEDGSVGLRPTSLTLTENRIAVIGLNGSGKTTLLRLLDGSLTPSTGNILIQAGSWQTDTASSASRRNIEYIIGKVRREELDESLVRADRLENGLDASLRRDVRDATDRSNRIADVLAQYGISDLARQPGMSLSAEQRHLAAFAVASLRQPAAIVADEPTKGLDERSSATVARNAFTHTHQLIIATHDISLLDGPVYGIERALVLHEGSVIFDGPASDASQTYAALIKRLRQQA